MKFLRVQVLMLFIAFSTFGQSQDWHLLDLKQDHVFGISLDGAYKALKGKKAKTVIVGIVDSGVDTLHEDLKEVLWINSKEKRNGKDDDRNGYVDDKYGWGFIGGKGGNVGKDNIELTRLIRRGDGQSNPALQAKFDQERGDLQQKYNRTLAFKLTLDTIVKNMGIATPVAADFISYEPKSTGQAHVKQVLASNLQSMSLKDFMDRNFTGALAYYKDQLDYNYNVDFDPRGIVGDDYNNSREVGYGNSDVTGVDAHHGTHVAGIVAASRDNNLGMKGVADHVKIMAIRAVPDGDERDKDVANGIRYAVDNGAKVINMSFGKGYSWDKWVVDEAARYAAAHDVLLVQAAGNSGEDIDAVANFPSRVFSDGSLADNWIVVGASGPNDNQELAAGFSNYGAKSVDLFAPGVQIYSCLPGSKYEKFNGTSMASPVVAGIAALIRSYFPKLTAVEVKDILLKSVIKPEHTVSVDRDGKKVAVPFSALCVTGGIVNAEAAVKLAAEYPKK